MRFGSKAQKVVLSIATVFAVLSTLYVLILAVITVFTTGQWTVLLIWALTVMFYVPILVKLFVITWRLISRIS